MRIDGHTHMTDPPTNILDILNETGMDRCIVCSSGLANGEKIHSLQDAKDTMARVAKAQNSTVASKSISAINQEIAAAVQACPERLIGFGKIDLFEEDYPRHASEIMGLGLKGIGELVGVHNHVGKLAPLVVFSHQHGGFPLFVHCDYPVDAKDLSEIAALCRQHENAVVIFGHYGGDFWIDAMDYAKSIAGIYLDISEVVNQVPLIVGVTEIPHKMLYGTDAPWDLAKAIQVRVDSLPVSPAIKEKIFGGNLQALLRL